MEILETRKEKFGKGKRKMQTADVSQSRPDLGEDSILWSMLPELAYDADPELYGRRDAPPGRCSGSQRGAGADD